MEVAELFPGFGDLFVQSGGHFTEEVSPFFLRLLYLCLQIAELRFFQLSDLCFDGTEGDRQNNGPAEIIGDPVANRLSHSLRISAILASLPSA